MTDPERPDLTPAEEPTVELPRDRAGSSGSDTRATPLPRIPDYNVIRQIGRGGMGIVYEAEQVSLARKVALKIVPELRMDDDHAVQRFEREARTIARLQHDHIVPIYDIGEADGTHYYTMRLIDGAGLDQLVRNLRLHVEESNTHQVSDRRRLLAEALAGTTQRADSPDSTVLRDGSAESSISFQYRPARSYYHQIARIGAAVADALAYAHAEGVIHRDIKPSNLIRDSTGKVWLTDFGLAKTENSDLTETGNILGTVRFMAPEQLVGDFDHRSDIYSLGITLYELLGLQPAFRGASQLAIIRKVRDTVPQTLQSIDSGIPVDLQTIVEKATAKEPRRRYQDAAELAEDLRLFLEGRPIRARRVTWVERLVSWSKRNPAIAASVAGIVVLVITGLIGTTLAALQFRDLATEQTRLREVADKATAQAEAEALRNSQNLYYAEMKLAADASRSPSGLSRLTELLDHWVPSDDDPIDRRGFEWYLLDAVARPDRRVVDDHDNPLLDWDQEGSILCRGKLSNIVIITAWPGLEELARARVPGELHQVKINPAGTHVAMLTTSGEVRIWEWERDERFIVEMPSAMRPSEEEPSENSAAASPGIAKAIGWSHSGDLLAVSVDHPELTREVVLVSPADWTIRRRVSLPSMITGIGSLADLAFNCDDSKLAITCKQGFRSLIQIIDTTTWAFPNARTPRAHEIEDMAWHPNQDRIVMITTDSQVIVWNLPTDTVASTKTETFMQSVNWSPDGATILVSGNGAARLLDATSLTTREIDFAGVDGTVYSIFHPDGRTRLVSSSYSGLFAVSPDCQAVRRLSNPVSGVGQSSCFVDWSPDGGLIATSTEPPLTIWDADTAAPHWPRNPGYTIEGQPVGWLSPDVFASHYRDELTLWDRTGSMAGSTLKKPPRWHLSGPDSTGERLLLVAHPGYSQWKFAFWNRRTGEVREIHSLISGRLGFHGVLSPDDSKIVVGSDMRMIVLDARDGSFLADIDMRIHVDCAAWSHDGRWLACGTRDRDIVVYDTKTYEVLDTYRGHTGKLAALAWSPDHTRLASSGFDNTIRLWDPNTRKSTLVLPTSGVVRAIEWSPDGRRLATMSQNGEGVIWDASRGYAREFAGTGASSAGHGG